MSTAIAADPKKPRHPFFLGGLATMGASVFSNPFEVVKIRMQLQGELQKPGSYSKSYKNFGHGFFTIFKEEGIRGLQRGLGPALAYQAFMNGMRLGLYDPLREFLHDNDDKFVFIHRPLAGATAGALGAVMGSPFYMAKTRMQADSHGHIAVGTQHNYKSTADCFSKIYRTSGVRGLYVGVTAAIPRVSVGSAVQLTSYDACKAMVISNGIPNDIRAHLASSLLASFFLVIAMNPFDVVSTRMYNQPQVNGKGTLYKNIFDCVYKLTKTEQLRSFYKGTGAHYVRLGPHTVLTFVFWEQLKALHLRIAN